MNRKQWLYATCAIAIGIGVSLPGYADGGYIRTAPPLDEPRGYCLDVAGFGENARPDEPLRVHTCKYGEDNVDQLFKWVDNQTGHVSIPAYNRCLAVDSANQGSEILVSECSGSELQAWTFVPNGNLSLRAHPGLCLTVGEERKDAGSAPMVFPGYSWRAATLEACRERGDPLQDFRWGRDDEHRRGHAAGLRSGMSAQIANGILDMDAALGSEILSQTTVLYEHEPRTFRPGEVERTADISYGSHDRQKLDVHVDTRRRNQGLQPVVIFIHGGGYVRGSKESSHNVADFFASVGLVGVSATYRLAPEIQWPEGARDVGMAVTWVRENIEEFGGDPERIFVIGKSAGAGHVATYALRPDVLGSDYAVPAGAILISGGYENDSSSPSENHIAYFGDDLDAWRSRQVVGNISRPEIPLLLTTSERDPKSLGFTALALANDLAINHGALARIRQLAGHNHYSSNMSIGTSDRVLSDEILDFVLNTNVVQPTHVTQR